MWESGCVWKEHYNPGGNENSHKKFSGKMASLLGMHTILQIILIKKYNGNTKKNSLIVFSPKVIKKFYRKFLLSKIKIENIRLFSKTVDVKKIK